MTAPLKGNELLRDGQRAVIGSGVWLGSSILFMIAGNFPRLKRACSCALPKLLHMVRHHICRIVFLRPPHNEKTVVCGACASSEPRGENPMSRMMLVREEGGAPRGKLHWIGQLRNQAEMKEQAPGFFIVRYHEDIIGKLRNQGHLLCQPNVPHEPRGEQRTD